MMQKNVVVIGAGITGLTAAYYLSRAGYKVSVCEQERYPAMRTSYANGGQISVSNSEVWTTWGNVFKGIRWMFKKDAPLLIRIRPDWGMIKWLTKFMWHTVKGDYRKNSIDTIQLGMDSRKLYAEIIAEEKLEFDQSACGILHFYKDPSYLKNAEAAQSLYHYVGCEWDMLTPAKTKSLDPALENIEDVLGGAWTKSDWTGDIHKFCTALAKVLADKYGVTFYYGQQIHDVMAMREKYDNIVVSAGVGSIKLAECFGDTLSMYPVKGYSITITVAEQDLRYLPKISLLDDQAKIVTSTLGNRFRVAGTAELTGENYDIRQDRIQPLLSWVHTNFPKMNTSDYSSWACLRPMSADMMPIVRKSKTPNVYYHTGHGHLGWTLSPATAKSLVNLMQE